MHPRTLPPNWNGDLCLCHVLTDPTSLQQFDTWLDEMEQILNDAN